ncbi:carboxylase [Williamwhitmania taraxaci]|uniref:Oxaloacetate decarboxylase, alpha subunit/pyruvate carboxylase subunit B n=1 Tax=Williamwhitmania taraxaci TaxID=1640674 RepID=A0A1G6H3X9_9BACT|nr:carboxylase [Williamwhitmania taraxaci]SDB88635.1 oxaloacetate decarboxylase, alpha subunit/pyruvate carboxylase subunit B [Williamwhitmania taraxaci]
MARKLLVRDVTLRDGQQSLFATRMTQEQIDRVLPIYREAGFYAMEVWGGAIPDSIMRYLNEDPWERLETIKREIGDVSKLTALSRGRNLFGYNPYPESVIEGFNRNAVKSGISIMRIFDALNDASNIRSTIKYVKENGGIADCTVCYTVDPKFTRKEKFLALLKGKRLPSEIFTIDYFVKMARELEGMGADMITLKDMAGLIPPSKAGKIIRALKSNVSIPIDFHTHCTPGYGLGAFVMALVNGIDILDTAILNFSGGPAAPSFEIIQIFCNKLDIETGVNLDAVVRINKELKVIRQELASVDSYKLFPIDFDITKDKLPANIEKLFDQAVEAAKADDEEALLKACYGIEKYFNFPEPDEVVKFAEVPGGMYTNMLAQLKQLQLENLIPRVMEIIPTVRLAAGCPPLVTPTSQIVGAQAVNCIIDENKGLPFYTSKSIQFVNLVKGSYGKTPIPVDPDFRMKIAGTRDEVPYNTEAYQRQPNPSFPEYGKDIFLAKNEKEELLLELFPAVASKYLEDKIHGLYLEKKLAVDKERAAREEAERERIANMTTEERNQMVTEALLNM